MTGRCRLIALTHASNVTGAVTEVGRIVAAARAVGARVLLDGAQRAPHGPLDLPALGVDAYAMSGHKMFGPTGAGALWVRRELLDELPPFLGGGEMISRVTFAATSYAAAAASLRGRHAADRGRDRDGRRRRLARRARLAGRRPPRAAPDRAHPGRPRPAAAASAILGPSGLQGRIGVVSFEAEGAHAHDLCHLLGAQGVCLRGGHHCAQPLMDALRAGRDRAREPGALQRRRRRRRVARPAWSRRSRCCDEGPAVSSGDPRSGEAGGPHGASRGRQGERDGRQPALRRSGDDRSRPRRRPGAGGRPQGARLPALPGGGGRDRGARAGRDPRRRCASVAEQLERAIRKDPAAGDGLWPELGAFAPVHAHKSRHDCVLLPFEALTEALDQAEAASR